MDMKTERLRLVARDLEAHGIHDPLVLDAMRKVERERFVAPSMAADAYANRPLPIGHGQTISQPFIVAYMAQALQLHGGEKVLEIGTGSGYAAAVLAEIAAAVYSIERIRELAETATQNLANAGYANVHVRHADGTQGWPEAAPFDAILVSAGGPDVPATLVQQLKPGGRLVIPVGRNPASQHLVRVTTTETGEVKREELLGVRFVPLIGQEGWSDDVDYRFASSPYP
jgi:protein-L-isoaspartate(D-aspartate) O-methyltransferase